MSPVLTKHFSELSTREYHRIVQAREAVFFLEQHITEPDADAVDPQSVFMWMEDGGRVVAFLRIIPAGIAYAEASVGRVLVDAAYRRRRFYAVDAVAEILYSSEDGGMTFHADTLNLTVKGSNAVMLVLPYEEEIRVEGKTVSMLLLVVKKICGLQLMMVCTALPLQKNLISVFWIRYVPSILLVSARQSRVMIILPSI